MPQPLRHTRYRYPGKEQQRGMGMPKSVNGNLWNTGLSAPPRQNRVHGRVVDLSLDEDGAIWRHSLNEFGELNDELPIQLHLSNGRAVFCRQEAAFFLVVPCLIDRKHLTREIEIIGSHGQRLRKPQARFRDEQYKPIPINALVQVERIKQLVELKLIQVLRLFCARPPPLYDRLTRGVTLKETFIDGIENGAFKLMVKIHRRLAFMMFRIPVQQLLIGRSSEIFDG